MASSYSVDLRLRIIELLKENKTQIFISELLKVSTKTIQRLWKLYQETGNVFAKKAKVTRPRSVDYGVVTEYMDKNPDKTLVEVGEHFGIKNVWYIVKKMKYTYKKKTFIRGKVGKFERRI